MNDKLIERDGKFAAAVWEAIKGDHNDLRKQQIILEAFRAADALEPSGEQARKYRLGDRVTKTKGSSWTGFVVGFYSTALTPIGYAVESENEPGSVQIYPESALEARQAEHEAT